MEALRIGCVPDLPLQKLQSFLGPLHRLEAGLRVEVVHLRTRDQLERCSPASRTSG